MKIFFDAEFNEDGATIDLISIGLVREDGAALYLENAECDLTRCDDWLQRNVIARLDGPKRSRVDMAKEIRAFAGDAPEFWAYYGAYDWVALNQLYGRLLDVPKGWPKLCRDLKQEALRFGLALPQPDPAFEHHALYDAQWTFEMYRDYVGPALAAEAEDRRWLTQWRLGAFARGKSAQQASGDVQT